MGIMATVMITVVLFLVIGMGSWQLRERGTWKRLRETHDLDQRTPA